MTWRKAATLLLFVCGAWHAKAGSLPARQDENILERLEQRENWRASALQDYEVHRKYLVVGPRFSQKASMEVRVNYIYPGRKSVQVLWADGSRWLQTRVLDRVLEAEVEAASDEGRGQTRFNSQNYAMRVAGVDTVGGRRCFIVELTPRESRKFLLKGRIWVDAEDAAVVRLEGEPAAGCSFWVHNVHISQTYRKVGLFWLVAAIRTDADVRFFGPAHLDVDYYGYEVNSPVLESARRAREDDALSHISSVAQ